MLLNILEQDGAIEKAKEKLREDNWEYFNCLTYMGGEEML